MIGGVFLKNKDTKVVIISTVSNMRAFFDFSDSFELLAFYRKYKHTPVKIRNPSPLAYTI